jgi:hypothetical protein
MEKPADRSLSVHRWLPQVLAILLAAGPVRAGEQTLTPQQPPTNPPAVQAPPAAQASPSAQPTRTTQPPPTTPAAPVPMIRSLKVTALAGNKEMNDLERGLVAPLVIQVLDQNDRPVEGAEVVFRFPLNGPGAIFRGGNTSQTVRTNGQGQAAATNWTANNQVGAFSVHVSAAYGSQLGETTVSMTNVTRIVEDNTRKKKLPSWYAPKWVKIALIAGGAATVAGVILATRGGGSSSTPTITITPGSPTVGGPH